MKHLFVKIIAVVAITFAALAQSLAQDSFAYQAVIRDAQGELITNKEVSLKFSLMQGGKTYYIETQKAPTNQYGNIDVKVGAGTALQGKMSDVPWQTLDVTMKVDVDVAGGDNFITLGETQISAAPYAMYAATSGEAASTASSKGDDVLFEVTDRNGNTVFAVTPNGIVVYVDDTDPAKAARSGFLVTGRTARKDQPATNYFSVTADGTQIYVDDPDSNQNKAARSGFLVTGRTARKDGQVENYLAVNADGTKVYIDDPDKGDKAARSGFLVTGRTARKDGKTDDLLAVNAEGTQVYVDDVLDSNGDKAARSGFLVTGRTARKDGHSDDLLKVDADGTQMFVDIAPDGNQEGGDKAARSGFLVTGRTASKEANDDLFSIDGNLTRVYIDDADTDGDDKAARSGFLVTGRTVTKGEPHVYLSVTGEKTSLKTSEFTVVESNEELGTVQSLISVNNGQVEVQTDLSLVGETVETVEVDMKNEFELDITKDSAWVVLAKIEDFNPEYNRMFAIYNDGAYSSSAVDTARFLYGDVHPVEMKFPYLLFDSYGRVTHNGKKAALVVFQPDETGIIIRAFEPFNNTIEFGLMNSDDESVKITANISAKDGLPFAVPGEGEFDGGKMVNKGGGYFGSQIMLIPVPEDGNIFGGWIQTIANGQGDPEEFYLYDAYINGYPLIDEALFGGKGLTPVFTEPVLYVGNTNNEIDTNNGLSADEPINSVENTLYYMAQLAKIQPTTDKIDWTIKVVGEVKGSQAIPETTKIRTYVSGPDGTYNDVEETIYVKDIANSIRLTGNDENAKLNGGWVHTSNGWVKEYADAKTSSVLYVTTPVPVTIDNLTITGGFSSGGGLCVGFDACVTIADGTLITGNRADIQTGGELHGGGVFVAGDFNNGRYGTLMMTGGQITGNSATGYGGGIYGSERSVIAIGGSAVIGDTEITNAIEISDNACANSAKSGGGIYSLGNLYIGYKLKDGATEFSAKNLVEDENSTVTIQGNYATDGGGGGVLSTKSQILPVFKMYKTNVAYNRSVSSTDYGGAGVYVGQGFEGNGAIDYCKIYGNYSNKAGAGIAVLSHSLPITNSEIYGNSLDGSGSCIGGAGLVYSATGLMLIENTKIYNNDATLLGGGGILVYSNGRLSVNNCEIYGNKASNGAGILINGENAEAALCGNTIVGDKDAKQAPTSESVTSEDFKGNYSSNGDYTGGGICVEYGGTFSTGYNIINTEYDDGTVQIVGNYSAGNGGGISISGEESSMYLHNAIVAHNAAGGDGKGVYYQEGNGFAVGGSTIFNDDNDVYLATDCKINIDGIDDGTSTVATITLNPDGYTEGVPVLEGEAEAIAQVCNRFAVTPSGTDPVKYWRVATDGNLEEIIGTKSAPNAVGDIVFTDGSAIAYSDDLTLTQGQKNSAVAVIFDAENKKGVALGQSSDQTRWCANTSLIGYGDVPGACGQDNGWDNTNAIYALSDFEMNSGNYPPFEYAKCYLAGGYTDWYIPAIHELQAIKNNKETLNNAINKVGGTVIANDKYWSSSQDERGGNNSKYAYYVNISYNSTSTADKSYGYCNSRCVRQFGGNDDKNKLTTFYVAPNGDNDSNDGLSGNTPFATIDKAISMMTESNKNYLFVICGEVQGGQTIQNLPEGSTLTIMGKNGNATDILNGDESGTVLTINTAVPITIKNLKITGGYGSGIKMVGNANVTLGAGALVESNNAGQDGLGGGVNIAGGKLTMLNGCKVSSNVATPSGSGGGIYISAGATLDMMGGLIEYNQAGYLGNSVYVAGTFNMNGGTIKNNPTYDNGGDVRVDMGAHINIKGPAIIDNNDYVSLDNYATVNIVGALEGTGRVATIKPLNYVYDYDADDNYPLLTSDYQAYQNNLPVDRFAVAMYDGYVWSMTADAKMQVDLTSGKGTMKSLKGEFTVSSAGKKVQFSSGNLNYYTAQPTRWEFAAHQYDDLDNINYTTSPYSFKSCIDLFGYGTSGYKGYDPTRNTSSSSDYYSGHLTEDGEDYDWGVRITKDYKTKEQWRTLTQDEWNYLLSRRDNNNKLLYGLGRVNNKIGLILLPDDWSSDGMPTFTSGNLDYDNNNQYDSDQWPQMEAKGAVFLPATGYRYIRNNNMEENNTYQGYYWSATRGKILFFDGQSGSPQSSDRKCETRSGTVSNGYAVRLVHDYEKDYTEIFNFSTSGENATITKYIGDEANVTIPETVKIDGTVYTVTAFKGDAFDDNNYHINVKSVTIPQSVTSISGSQYFRYSSELEAINVASENAKYYSVDGVLYEKSSDGKSILWRYPAAKTGEEFTIPDNVITIEYSAFRANRFLQKVTISKDVSSINEYAFGGCVALTTFIVNEDNQSYSSDDGILFNKSKTKLVRYPIAKAGTSYDVPSYVTSLFSCAFAECANLESVSIHDGVVAMDGVVFQGNSVIKYVTLPAGLTKIPSSTFYDCSSLLSVEIPSSVKSIENQAFQSCSSLTTITIPNGVETLGSSAFVGCRGLTSIYIPQSLKSIGNSAFSSCSKLSEVKYGGSEEDRSGISIGTSNDSFNNATWSYNQQP